MSKSDFFDRIRVDQATIDRCNAVLKQASQREENRNEKKSGLDNGGYERGDDGPASQGREPGFKYGDSQASQNNSNTVSGNGQNGSGQTGNASQTPAASNSTEGVSTGGETGSDAGCESGSDCGCGM